MGALGLPGHLCDAYEPTRIPFLPAHGVISSIAAGHYHSLAVTSSGEVWSWGRNDEGQLGRGLATTRDTWHEPRKVEGLEHIRARAAFASGVVSAVVGDDGSLWVWGRSKRGQLGLGSGVTEAIKPTKVNALEGEDIVKIFCAGVIWMGHVLAQTSDGKLFGWGNSGDGGLGILSGNSDASSTPLPDSDPSRTPRASSAAIMEAVKRMVLDKMEKEKSMPIVWEPCKLEELDGRMVSDVACGLDHSLVLCSDGSLLSCGRNTYGQLGRPCDGFRMLPVALPFPPVSLAAGLGHCLVLCRVPQEEESTGIVSWGWNQSSQLGRQGEGDRPEMVNGMAGEKPVVISGGRVHSIAITSGGNALGMGSSVDEPEPAWLESLEGLQVLQAACGFDHSLLLVAV
ncbi:unnamed protein product [Spirodela intermedia]|uniref:RCC1-like domain-containing protein n=1 Tax=Spirodela intermedia TaxID=51605 RepID=A0A7I8JL57_SPIIN|nr:unnamed protein product [Spirodela intermedia]CAA6670790.1 unnamed protein product [Spirodela intermedia]